MRILIVEGNTAATGHTLQQAGLPPYAQSFASVLLSLHPEVSTEIAYPCEHPDGGLPAGSRIEDYHGIAWTGSSLCISEGETPPVQAQLSLARRAFASGVPVFGSCWGMQVMTCALGGQVTRNPGGREIGMARHIQLSAAGMGHPMFEGKPHCFDALASHRDEVTSLPAGAELLAGNHHSPVQALSIERDGGQFWGVQYHPEFDLETIATLIRLRGDTLLAEGFFKDAQDVERYTDKLIALYRDLDRRDSLAWQLGITPDVLNPACRHREIHNWLQQIATAGD